MSPTDSKIEHSTESVDLPKEAVLPASVRSSLRSWLKNSIDEAQLLGAIHEMTRDRSHADVCDVIRWIAHAENLPDKQRVRLLWGVTKIRAAVSIKTLERLQVFEESTHISLDNFLRDELQAPGPRRSDRVQDHLDSAEFYGGYLPPSIRKVFKSAFGDLSAQALEDLQSDKGSQRAGRILTLVRLRTITLYSHCLLRWALSSLWTRVVAVALGASKALEWVFRL